MLLLDNDTVRDVLTMDMTMEALEKSYLDMARGTAICRPRIDVAIPTGDPGREYRWGTMEGGSADGYFAIRMKSDIVFYKTDSDGTRTREKFCREPGTYCGLVLLTSVRNGEPLAFLNDGVLQHMRVGGDGGLGVKYMARKDAEVVGMLGTGGMANSHMKSFAVARRIRKLQVYSPTRVNREAFGARMADTYGIEVTVCDAPEQVYRGADIVAALTDAAEPVLDGALVEPGTHVINIGGGGLPDQATIDRVDVYLRFGDTPPPVGHEDGSLNDEFLRWQANGNGVAGKSGGRAHGVMRPDIRVSLLDLAEGRHPGRTSDDQITWSERGNLQGAQFFAVAARAFEAARERGLGRELPTEWFLQTIRN